MFICDRVGNTLNITIYTRTAGNFETVKQNFQSILLSDPYNTLFGFWVPTYL